MEESREKKGKEEKIKKEKEKKIYVAYGSNMDIGRMFKRCSGAQYRGVGVLEGYALTFQKSISGYYANIVPSKAGAVPVVLFQITEEDEKSLDFYEGYPVAYSKREVEVITEEGMTERGIVYVLPKNREYGIPGVKYYKLIQRAYEIYGFDEYVLREGIERSYKKAKKQLEKKEAKIGNGKE